MSGAFENLLFKGSHPGPIPPLQGIRDKEYVARITGEHIVHIATEVRIVLFQNFCLGCLSARSVQLSKRVVGQGVIVGKVLYLTMWQNSGRWLKDSLPG